MSEKRAPEPDRMDRLMELQSRLRELTEEKKAKWERLGQPLPEVSSAGGPAAPAMRVPPDRGTEPPGSPGASSRAGAAPAADPPVPEGLVAATADTPAPAVAVAGDTSLAEASSSHGGSAPDDDAVRYSRRRGTGSERAREARELWGRARAGGRMAVAFARRSVERVRDLSGTLGARETKPKVRRGDPITAEDLIDDRSLSARLLGAAVFFIGLVAIGAVALVQLGKLEVPWLEESSLPAATGSTGAGPDASETSGGAGADPGSSSTAPLVRDDGPEAAESTTAAGGDAGHRGAEAALGAAADARTDGDPSTASGGLADSRQSREFDRLRGELAFRLGEYEIVTAEFERGEAGCDELTSQFRSVDDAHLLVSRVVARWREVPWSQVKAYDELSQSVDRVLSHYSASGCGLDGSQPPPDH